jgi:serine/threonine protein kinase
MTLYRLLNGDSMLPDPAELGMQIDDAIVAGTYPNRNRFRDHVPAAVARIVRRAIAFDPSRRTTSAAELRHDIERVMPAVSFRELASPDVATWEGSSPSHFWEAGIQRSPDGFDFVIRRGRLDGTRRTKITADCAVFSTEAAARRHARSVLQRLGRVD